MHVNAGLCTCVPIDTTKCQHAHADNIDQKCPERKKYIKQTIFSNKKSTHLTKTNADKQNFELILKQIQSNISDENNLMKKKTKNKQTVISRQKTKPLYKDQLTSV
jgi:hypothetical protein